MKAKKVLDNWVFPREKSEWFTLFGTSPAEKIGPVNTPKSKPKWKIPVKILRYFPLKSEIAEVARVIGHCIVHDDEVTGILT